MQAIGIFFLCVFAGLVSALVAPTVPSLVHENCPSGFERVCGRFTGQVPPPLPPVPVAACLAIADVDAVARFANSVLQAEGLEPAFPADQLRERFRSSGVECPKLEHVLSLACMVQTHVLQGRAEQPGRCDFRHPH